MTLLPLIIIIKLINGLTSYLLLTDICLHVGAVWLVNGCHCQGNWLEEQLYVIVTSTCVSSSNFHNVVNGD